MGAGSWHCSGVMPAKGEVLGAHKVAPKSAAKDYLSRNLSKGVREAHADRPRGPANQP